MREEKPTKTYEKGDVSPSRNRKFMAVYIIGLFSVALVLIFVSYLTQARAEKQVQSMSDQLGQTKTEAQGAQQRAEQLQIQFDQLQKDYDALKKDYDGLEGADAQLQQTQLQLQQKDDAMQALAIFWKVEQAYQKRNYGECKRLINKLTSDGYADDLSGDALTEYQTIRKAMGYTD